MSEEQFEQPTQERFKVADYVGSLLLITPHSAEDKVFTAGGDPTPTVVCDVVVVDSNPPEVWPQAWITNRVLYRTLVNKLGKRVLGRLAMGEKGKSPQAPYILDEYTDADAKLASKVIKTLADDKSEAFKTDE